MHLVVSNSLQSHGLEPTRLLYPWNSPGKNIGLGCHSLLQGTFLIQGSKVGSPALQAGSLPSEPTGKSNNLISFFFFLVVAYHLSLCSIHVASGREECGHMSGAVLHWASSVSHYFVSDTFFLIMHICLSRKFPNWNFITETKPKWNANPKPIAVGGHLLIWPVRCLLHPYQTIIRNCFTEFIYYILKGISGAKLISFFVCFNIYP